MRYFTPITADTTCTNCGAPVAAGPTDGSYSPRTNVTYDGDRTIEFPYCSNRCVNADADRSAQVVEDKTHWWAHCQADMLNKELNALDAQRLQLGLTRSAAAVQIWACFQTGAEPVLTASAEPMTENDVMRRIASGPASPAQRIAALRVARAERDQQGTVVTVDGHDHEIDAAGVEWCPATAEHEIPQIPLMPTPITTPIRVDLSPDQNAVRFTITLPPGLVSQTIDVDTTEARWLAKMTSAVIDAAEHKHVHAGCALDCAR